MTSLLSQIQTTSNNDAEDSDREPSRSQSSSQVVARPSSHSVAERAAITAHYEDDLLEREKITLWKRFKLLFKPIYKIDTIDDMGRDKKTLIVLVPEAFRMLFYAAFIGFLALGYVITSASGNLDIDDNPIKNRFGTNNMCIYFDEKPFIYISSSLWILLLFILLMYEMTEWYRVHDSYR